MITLYRWPALIGICLFWQPAMFSCIQLLIMFSLSIIILIVFCRVLFALQKKISP